MQVSVLSAVSYTTTGMFTGIPPIKAVFFVGVSYLIDQIVSPIFANWLEPYRNAPLVPLAGQITHLTLSGLSAHSLGLLLGMGLTRIQILQTLGLVALAFFIAFFFLSLFHQFYPTTT